MNAPLKPLSPGTRRGVVVIPFRYEGIRQLLMLPYGRFCPRGKPHIRTGRFK